MAAILALAGGFLGSFGALVAVILFDASLLQAIGLWSGVGIGMVALGVMLTLLPRRSGAYDPADYPDANRA